MELQRRIHLFRSPGYGLTLAAETKNGSVISAESCSRPRANEGDPTTITIPEELAKEAVFKLLDEIYKVQTIERILQKINRIIHSRLVLSIHLVKLSPFITWH